MQWHDSARGAPNNEHHLESFHFCHCAMAQSIRELIREIVKMTPETKETVAGYPNISTEDSRLIFIRNKGREDWKNRSADFQVLIASPKAIKDTPRAEVIAYISFLHTMIKELRAYAQGLEIEYAHEVEPEIEANHTERETRKDAKRSAPRTLEGMLAKSGLTKEALLEAIKIKLAREAEAKAKGGNS